MENFFTFELYFVNESGECAPTPFSFKMSSNQKVEDIKKGIGEKIRTDLSKKVIVMRNRVSLDSDIIDDYFKPNQVKQALKAYVFLQDVTIDLSKSIVPQLPKLFVNCMSDIYDSDLQEPVRPKQPAHTQREPKPKEMQPPRPPSPVMEPPGWDCPACTFRNKPARPGCEICGTDRPLDYKMPPENMLSAEDRKYLNDERAMKQQWEEYERQMKEQEKEEAKQNYANLMALDKQQLYSNLEKFNCPICFEEIPIGEGVMLRSCTHTFCKECLKEHVQHSQNIPIVCPENNGDDDKCHGVMEHREICGLMGDDLFKEYLQKESRLTESRMKNSFHCRTTDCTGWVVYEDENNKFTCGVCNVENCITCKAQHAPLSCKDYQDDLRRRAARNENARKDLELLERLVREGEAMKCPQCEVILQKKDGCDWMQCTMCKTEICWATRGPRWGPGGRGDNSGGCKCRVGNQKCHPKCMNCH